MLRQRYKLSVGNAGYLFIFLCLSMPALPQKLPTLETPEEPVFVVTRNRYAQGYDLSRGAVQPLLPRIGDVVLIGLVGPCERVGTTPYVEEGQHDEAQECWKTKYYRPGAKYRLLWGGGDAGTITVGQLGVLQCDSYAGLGRAEGSVDFGGKKDEVIALASNSRSIKLHKNGRRSSTRTERKAATEIAKQILRQRGLSEALLRTIDLEHLVAVRINQASPAVSLIGNFSAGDKSGYHRLFIILEPSASGFHAGLVKYHKVEDTEDGKDEEREIFGDTLDLDGDGVDEIVTEQTGYESEQFNIYKRSGHGWQIVHVGAGAGC